MESLPRSGFKPTLSVKPACQPEPDFESLSLRIYRLCMALLGDPDLAQDAAQESMSRAWAKRNRRKPSTSWWVWMGGFAVRVCREMKRAERLNRFRRRSLEGNDESIAEQANSTDPQHDGIHRAILRLPTRQREIVVLRLLAAMSTQEAANTLGCPPGTVKSNLFKAIRVLRTELLRTEHGDELLAMQRLPGRPSSR